MLTWDKHIIGDGLGGVAGLFGSFSDGCIVDGLGGVAGFFGSFSDGCIEDGLGGTAGLFGGFSDGCGASSRLPWQGQLCELPGGRMLTWGK